MTPLEVIFTIFIWIVVGIWICYKYNWYDKTTDWGFGVFFTIIFSPLSLVFAFFEVFLIKPWKND
jgi:hypothetical protein